MDCHRTAIRDGGQVRYRSPCRAAVMAYLQSLSGKFGEQVRPIERINRNRESFPIVYAGPGRGARRAPENPGARCKI